MNPFVAHDLRIFLKGSPLGDIGKDISKLSDQLWGFLILTYEAICGKEFGKKWVMVVLGCGFHH